jgi:hypothetical protein
MTKYTDNADLSKDFIEFLGVFSLQLQPSPLETLCGLSKHPGHHLEKSELGEDESGLGRQNLL